jgi:hypothetical protein
VFYFKEKMANNYSSRTAMEMVVLEEDSSNQNYYKNLIQGMQVHHFDIYHTNRSNDTVISRLSTLVSLVQKSIDTNALIEIKFSPKCTYDDLIYVQDLLTSRNFSFVRLDHQYYSRLLVKDTTNYVYPL